MSGHSHQVTPVRSIASWQVIVMLPAFRSVVRRAVFTPSARFSRRRFHAAARIPVRHAHCSYNTTIKKNIETIINNTIGQHCMPSSIISPDPPKNITNISSFTACLCQWPRHRPSANAARCSSWQCRAACVCAQAQFLPSVRHRRSTGRSVAHLRITVHQCLKHNVHRSSPAYFSFLRSRPIAAPAR